MDGTRQAKGSGGGGAAVQAKAPCTLHKTWTRTEIKLDGDASEGGICV